jgi:hypothetical protein
VFVAGQALSGTLLLITPCDGLYISSARMLQSIQHTLSPSFSVYNPALNRATVSVPSLECRTLAMLLSSVTDRRSKFKILARYMLM